MTPDEIRQRLERVVDAGDGCHGCLRLIGVLHALLPDLVMVPGYIQRFESQISDYNLTQQGDTVRTVEMLVPSTEVHDGITYEKWIRDAGIEDLTQDAEINRLRVQVESARRGLPSAPHPCPDCTPEAPCERVRTLMGTDA